MSVRAFRDNIPSGFQRSWLVEPYCPSSYRRPDPRDPGLARNMAKSPAFLAGCKAVGIEPTVRQARKWRRGEGRAYGTAAAVVA